MSENLPVPGQQGAVFKGGMGSPNVPEEWGVRNFFSGVQTSLDFSNQLGRAMVMACLKDDCIPGKEVINTPIAVTDWLIHPVETTDPDTGEVQRFLRTCLVLDDRRIVAFGSSGVAKDLMLICGLFRPAPWKPPLKIKVRVRDIGNGRQWYVIDVIEDTSPGKPKGKTS